MTADNIRKAEAGARIGLAVFPVLVTPDPDNPHKTRKRPAISAAHEQGHPCKGECGKLGHGFYDATLDPYYAHDLFQKYPNAEVGVYMGKSGLLAADFDVKRTPDGDILVDGYENWLGEWLDLPDTFDFDSISGAGGKQYVYVAPEGVHLARKSDYRKIAGLDRQAGDSYSVWAGEIPASRDVFAAAPEWLLDASEVRSASVFQGAVQEWYETLEEGDPSLFVRNAMEDARKLYAEKGDDFSHSDMVEFQHRAVRLGAEGHAGIPELLALLEELTLNRTGAHSRNEDEYAHEFAEALASGIKKHGAAIQLRHDIPAYSVATLPAGVPTNLISGDTGDKGTFTQLLRSLLEHSDDDLFVTSVLWSSPRTKDLARQWGIEFVHQRVVEARAVPEPVRENPSKPERIPNVTKAPVEKVQQGNEFLSSAELKLVNNSTTFIDRYLEASGTKGFVNPDYAIPAAWTLLSMAFGRKAFIPLSKSIGVNLWFMILGYSTTGKSTEDRVLKGCLDILMSGSDVYYNLGAESSPEGLQEALVLRDGLPSIIQDDEVAGFLRAIRTKEHMGGIPQYHADWYEGGVKPSQKVRLKDLRGKSAKTSLCIHFSGTPDKTLGLLDLSMFEDGYLARYNWVWASPNADEDRKYRIRMTERESEDLPGAMFDVLTDMMHARFALGDKVVPMTASDEVQDRLNNAHRSFDAFARKHPKFDKVSMVPDRMGMETVWKCAALLALYEGRVEIELRDALIAINHVGSWLKSALRVANEISESPYSRDLEEMEDFITEEGGTVTRAKFLHHFRGKVVRTQREIDDRIGYLTESGRILRSGSDGAIVYSIN